MSETAEQKEPVEPSSAPAVEGGRPAAETPVGIGLYANAERSRVSGWELVAIALTAVWLAGCAVFFLVLDGSENADPFRMVMTVLAIFMPVALIWVAATATRSARIMREESARLQTAIDALRHTYLQQQQSGGLGRSAAAVERKLDQLTRAQRQTETAIATFTSIRPAAAATATPVTAPIPATSEPSPPPVAASATTREADDQPALALGTPAEELAPPLAMEDFIRALHFPENAEDKEGFRALRRALQDHQVAGLVRAAQDALTLLSEDGIYMDDLRPDLARPETWRKFAAGERGRAIAALGGIRDRSSLALAAGRMRKDPVFRDAVHHFLRKFDHVFSAVAANATDAEIAAMADTRTARAFMLLGRVTGTFD